MYKSHPSRLHPFLEVIFPTVRQSVYGKSSVQELNVGGAESFLDVKASNVGYGYAVRVAANLPDGVSRADFSFARYSQVESRPATRKKSLYHVVRVKTDAKFVARKPWLRDDHFR